MIFFDSKMCFTSTKKLNKYFEFLEMMWKFTTISFDDFFSVPSFCELFVVYLLLRGGWCWGVPEFQFPKAVKLICLDVIDDAMP